MAVYTPVQVVALIKDVDTRLNNGQMSEGELLTATYIVLRESGGRTDAFNTNTNGTHDRGLWQWNDAAWPDITDAIAYDPVAATEAAFKVSKGWKDWSPWNTKGTNGKTTGSLLDVLSSKNKYWNQSAAERAKQALADVGVQVGGNGGFDIGLPYGADDLPVVGDVIDGLETVGDIATAGVRLIGKLMSPDFWKRIGIGALGVAIIVAAIVLYFTSQSADVAKAVT